MMIVLIVLDQLAKFFAYKNRPNFDLIGNFLRIHYIENTGTIFGLFENSNLIFLVLAIILCIAVIFYMKKNIERKSMKSKVFGLILAGGIGNIIDRIVRGFVVDFISLKWVGIFNLADSYIVIGVILIAFLEWKEMIIKKDISKNKE